MFNLFKRKKYIFVKLTYKKDINIFNDLNEAYYNINSSLKSFFTPPDHMFKDDIITREYILFINPNKYNNMMDVILEFIEHSLIYRGIYKLDTSEQRYILKKDIKDLLIEYPLLNVFLFNKR